jgi:hypothetical protein
MKFIAFWDVAPCSRVGVDRRFRYAYSLHHQGDDGSSKHLWNIGQLQRDYTALHPRTSYSSPWEREISHTSVSVDYVLIDYCLVLCYQRHHNPWQYNSHFHHRENLISHKHATENVKDTNFWSLLPFWALNGIIYFINRRLSSWRP